MKRVQNNIKIDLKIKDNRDKENEKMNYLLENLYKKRFCIPTQDSVKDYERGAKQVNECLCGNYNHVACIIKGKEREPPEM